MVETKWGHEAANLDEATHLIFWVESDASRICEKFHKRPISRQKSLSGAMAAADLRRGRFHSVSIEHLTVSQAGPLFLNPSRNGSKGKKNSRRTRRLKRGFNHNFALCPSVTLTRKREYRISCFAALRLCGFACDSKPAGSRTHARPQRRKETEENRVNVAHSFHAFRFTPPAAP
jgi:hypothetical protein